MYMTRFHISMHVWQDVFERQPLVQYRIIVIHTHKSFKCINSNKDSAECIINFHSIKDADHSSEPLNATEWFGHDSGIFWAARTQWTSRSFLEQKFERKGKFICQQNMAILAKMAAVSFNRTTIPPSVSSCCRCWRRVVILDTSSVQRAKGR
jgi:hypothetical protein